MAMHNHWHFLQVVYMYIVPWFRMRTCSFNQFGDYMALNFLEFVDIIRRSHPM